VIVFLNGAFVEEEHAVVSVFDRGFLYGDGLFETIRLYQGRPFRWDEHMDRLLRGAAHLNIRLPASPAELRPHVKALVEKNAMPDAVLRIVVSRGAGKRGYSPKGADRPTLVMSLHPAPSIDSAGLIQWRLVTASMRIAPYEPLFGLKTCNKLPQILARAEAEAQGADEALLLDSSGSVAEATSGNVFCVFDQTVCTPLLETGALPGITRAVIFEVCRQWGIPCHEKQIQIAALLKAEGAFLTSSAFEVVEAISLDGRELSRSALTMRVHQAYRALVSNHAG
jgi:aminodeoxychorismate lyase